MSPDDDLFGPPPEPPHPVEHARARARPPIVDAPDPRTLPKNRELRDRIARSRYLQDVCTCGVGDADRAITDARKPKCCQRCPWCDTRVKNGFYKEHIAWCMAIDRSKVPVPWWRRIDGVRSPQPAGVSDAKPIDEASTVHGDGGAQPGEGPQKKPPAGERRAGVRRGGSKKRPTK